MTDREFNRAAGIVCTAWGVGMTILGYFAARVAARAYTACTFNATLTRSGDMCSGDKFWTLAAVFVGIVLGIVLALVGAAMWAINGRRVQ